MVAALGGMGWTLSASELWVASQRAMPDWARGRMNATMVMAAQAATALGGVIWGLAANNTGVVPTFLGGGRVRPIDYDYGPCRSSPSDLDRLYQKREFRVGAGLDLCPEP
jgi:Transmembrane secretion effector